MNYSFFYLIVIYFCCTSSISAQNFEWAKSMGGSGSDWGNDIHIDKHGNIYTTGGFNGTVDFDPSSGIYNLTSKGESDIFIQKISSIISSVTIPSETNIIKAYPNPSRDKVQIDLEKSYTSITVEVHNILGQILNTYHYRNTQAISIDLVGQRGVYFLELYSDNERIGTVKVVKE